MLKDIRKRMGLTQEELGKCLQVDKRTVGNWERSNKPPMYAIYAYKGLATERAIQ